MTGEEREAISLYVHVPFCRRKCPYCHFYVLPNRPAFHEEFSQAIHCEWDLRYPELVGKKLLSLYFGGGTPALWGPQSVAQFLDRVRSYFSFSAEEVEITLEANPEDITLSLVESYRQVGVNRISMGVQSLDDKMLQRLGRTHTAKEAAEAVYCIREGGISSLSIDLLYDLPGQSLSLWEETLAQAQTLPITHLSLYNLTFEPHTVFYKKRRELQQHVPSSEESALMYRKAVEIFSRNPWHQYEISAFAHSGYESRHNTGYWTGRPFLGFGPSAFSFWKGKRFQNVPHLRKYCSALANQEDPIHFSEQLDPDAALRERLVIGLRRIVGVDLSQLPPLPKETVASLEEMREKGWCKQEKERWELTYEGRLFYDSVAATLI